MAENKEKMMGMFCECRNWARIDGRLTGHHPKCAGFVESRYAKATKEGVSYTVPEKEISTLFSDIGQLEIGDKLTVEIITMTKEEYDRLPEFTGF